MEKYVKIGLLILVLAASVITLEPMVRVMAMMTEPGAKTGPAQIIAIAILLDRSKAEILMRLFVLLAVWCLLCVTEIAVPCKKSSASVSPSYSKSMIIVAAMIAVLFTSTIIFLLPIILYLYGVVLDPPGTFQAGASSGQAQMFIWARCSSFIIMGAVGMVTVLVPIYFLQKSSKESR